MLLRNFLLSLVLLTGCDGTPSSNNVCETEFNSLEYSLKNAFLDVKQCEKVDISMLETTCNCDTSRYYGGVKLSKRTFCGSTTYLEEFYPYGGVTVRCRNGVVMSVLGGSVSTTLKTCYKEKLIEDVSSCNSYTTMACSQ